jgi:DNA-binding Xre family transcriptional regulator
MIITLNSYLARLKDEQNFKSPEQRLHVPNITELAEDIGLSRPQMQRIASSNIQSLKLNVGSDIIRSLRNRGFDTKVNDILDYRD